MPSRTLTELPTELKARILDKLLTQPLRHSETNFVWTVDSASLSLCPFPDDLLHSAQSSKELLGAVIHVLGSHSKLLNFYRSKRLSEWIPLLSKHVMAVSLAGISPPHLLRVDGGWVRGEDTRQKAIMDTLKALSENDVALVAFNLDNLVATEPHEAVQVAELVIKAIRRSSSSLKEIALNINLPSAIAVSSVTLPNLEVARISSEDYDGLEPDSHLNILSPSKTFGDIISGLNGHANRSLNTSTLRELRLHNIHKAPILRHGSCSSLFPAVQKLEVLAGINSEHSEIAKFIANFLNLKKLEWFTGWICAEDMNKIFAGCPDLENLHVSIGQINILPGKVDLAQNTPRLKELLISFRRKARILEMGAYLTSEQIEILGENCPRLRTLEMYIDSNNVRALSFLLGTHCRGLRELRLSYSRWATECLGRDGWCALAQAISASDRLCRFSLVGDRRGPMIEFAAHEMIQAIVDILKSMGDRAQRIVFRVPIDTRNPFVVMDAVKKTLQAGKTHCGSIACLALDFIQDPSQGGYQLDKGEEERFIAFFGEITDLERDYSISKGGNPVDIGNVEELCIQQHWVLQEEQDVDEDVEDEPEDQVLDENAMIIE